MPDPLPGLRYSNLTSSALAFRYQSNLIRPSLFLIIPTLRCDHNCLYCQVSRVKADAEGYDLDVRYIPHIIEKITIDSDPHEEWAETVSKTEVMRKVL